MNVMTLTLCSMLTDYLRARCTLTADNAKSIGWKPKYPPEHILEAADDEVDLILKSFSDAAN